MSRILKGVFGPRSKSGSDRPSHVFHRGRKLPTAVHAEGVWITDAEGRRYLDGAGGAIAVNVGHGDRALLDAMAAHATELQFVHATLFTTASLEAYADELAPYLPLDDPRIYPVSGGSEAVETALKLARAYHLARGETERHVVIGRRASFHGSTIGALDAAGQEAARAPYLPWLGRARHVSAAYEYRCPAPPHPVGCADWYAQELERTILDVGPRSVAAFIAEPISGSSLAAAVPCDGYWAAVMDVCRRHGVLVVADEVMTSFGRTGRWFACDHWDVRPDILIGGKGSTSGYVPFGFCAAAHYVYEPVRRQGFTHGFTWSHNGLSAAVARAVLRRLEQDALVDRSRHLGERLRGELADALANHPHVGDVRGLGLMIGIELVRDREMKVPFPRAEQVTERVVAAAREAGLLLNSTSGHLDGDGDLLMLGPPFILSDDEASILVERTAGALRTVGQIL
jgi:adenosylmethionine-8-amino-7-oxononanoate aminotransferase